MKCKCIVILGCSSNELSTVDVFLSKHGSVERSVHREHDWLVLLFSLKLCKVYWKRYLHTGDVVMEMMWILRQIPNRLGQSMGC